MHLNASRFPNLFAKGRDLSLKTKMLQLPVAESYISLEREEAAFNGHLSAG